MNQVVLVGRLVNEPTIKEIKEGKKVVLIKIAVNRNFKNEDGIYDTDIIPVILWNGVAEATLDYVHTGDVLGIKGRLQTTEDEVELVADKVTFLASKKKEDEE